MAFDRSFSGFFGPFSITRIISQLRHDLFYELIDSTVGSLEDLGSPEHGCNWTVCTKGFNADTVIYSAGVGRDITFEHALADKFGAKIVLLDPSPTALETMQQAENNREDFCFEKVALAGHSGMMELAPPPDPEEGSWLSKNEVDESTCIGEGSIKVPCSTIKDLMAKHGHKEIDLLKMDIEGAEYSVLETLLDSGVVIRQIGVEFHNGIIPGITRGDTIRMLKRLFFAGYRVIFKTGSNHTLMRTDVIRALRKDS